MATPRFTLYIKKNGTCPFSQRAHMFLILRLPRDQFVTKEIDTSDKPASFLQLNPEGKVPVLVDHAQCDKVVTDSALIVQYVDDQCKQDGDRDLACGHVGACVDAGSGVFSAFAKLMKNKQREEAAELKENALGELRKLDNFLKQCGHKFLLGDDLTEPDCAILPRLNHVTAAGPRFRDFHIPVELTSVCAYMEAAKDLPVWMDTCPSDKHICEGWAIHV